MASCGRGRWQFSDLVHAFSKVRTTQGVLNAFHLHRHPVIQTELDAATVRKGKVSRAVKHKTIREVFYHTDTHAIVQERTAVEKQVKQWNEAIRKQCAEVKQNPLEYYASLEATLGEKEEALVVRYQLKHFKEFSKEDGLYCVDASDLPALEDVMMGRKSFADADDAGLVADIAPPGLLQMMGNLKTG